MVYELNVKTCDTTVLGEIINQYTILTFLITTKLDMIYIYSITLSLTKPIANSMDNGHCLCCQHVYNTRDTMLLISKEREKVR